MLLPGPEAQQLATYIGWLMHRTPAASSPAACSSCPASSRSWRSAMSTRPSAHVGFVAALFFGLKAAVLAIVLEAVVRIGKRALQATGVMIALAAAAFVAIFFFGVPFPLIILGAGADRLSRRRAPAVPAFAAGGGHGGGKNVAAAVDSLLGEELPEHARPASRAGRSGSRRVWLPLWLVPVVALLLDARAGQRLQPDRASSSARWRWSPSAAPTRCWPMSRSRRSRHYRWLQPGEMLDGLGMAETTPGPLIMVLQFVGFMAAFRDPGALSPMLAGDARRPARDLGHLRAVLPLDLPRRAVHRDAARQQGARRRAVGDHRRGGRRDPQPGDLVRAPHRVPGDRAGARARAVVRRAGARERRCCRRWRSRRRGDAIFRFKLGMLTVLAGSCVAGVLLRLAGVI